MCVCVCVCVEMVRWHDWNTMSRRGMLSVRVCVRVRVCVHLRELR